MSSDLEYSPYDYRVHEDPYPLYARLRREAPLYRNEELDFWALSRHADVAPAFRDWESFSSVNGVTLDASAWGPHAHRTMSFLALDPPRHTRLRGLVSRGFTPRRVRELHPRIQEMSRTLLASLLEKQAEGEPFDFIADFAGVLPMDVISELMGVPAADRPELRRLADVVVHREEGVNDVPPAGMEAALTLVGYYEELLAAKRRKPGDDLTSALLEAEIDGDRLADREIIAFLFLMVIAGNETTTKLLANALYWAWKHGLTDRALKEPVDAWVEETLRYDTSSSSSRASSPRTSRPTGGPSPPDRGSSCWSAPPTATRRSSPTPTATTSTATPPSSSASAAAATTAWARAWHGWRPRSPSPSSPAWSRPTRWTRRTPSACTPPTCAGSPPCRFP